MGEGEGQSCFLGDGARGLGGGLSGSGRDSQRAARPRRVCAAMAGLLKKVR